VFDESGAPVPGGVRLAELRPEVSGRNEKWPGFPRDGAVCKLVAERGPDRRRIFLAPFGFVFRVTVAQ
jgi:hypothetical protein